MKKIYILLFLCSLTYMGQSQDVHFAHIHASPTFLNPALTGLFDGDVRLIGNYRNQWGTASSNYQTLSASVDGTIMNLGRNDFLAGGLRLTADRAGDLSYRTNQASMSVSLLKSLDRKGSQFLTLGVQMGLTQQSFNYSEINAFDPEPGLEGANNNMLFGDFAAGLSWYYVPQEETVFYIGGSMFHISTPRISFFPTQPGYLARIYRKVVLHGGFEHAVSNNLKIMPSFLFIDQGPHQEIMTGSFIKHRLGASNKNRSELAFYWGAWLRWYAEFDGTRGMDAVVGSIRIDYKKIAYTFSYDLNISSFSAATNGNGGPELSVIYMFDTAKKHRKNIVCPSF